MESSEAPELGCHLPFGIVQAIIARRKAKNLTEQNDCVIMMKNIEWTKKSQIKGMVFFGSKAGTDAFEAFVFIFVHSVGRNNNYGRCYSVRMFTWAFVSCKMSFLFHRSYLLGEIKQWL